MRLIFDYAVRLGLMLTNPARDIKRRKVVPKPIAVPTREQFKKLIEAIRLSDGRQSSQQKAKAGADLVELLAYSGCRIQEATSLRWADVDLEKNALTITGGDIGTKNHLNRTIPMTDALRSLLARLSREGTPQPTARIVTIHDAKKCLTTASKRLGYPRFTHHDFRHFFATTCIEAGVDIPTVSKWLGHKDGGALAMRVYGHLRQEHSFSIIKRVTF
jgi:integrase